MSVIIRLQNLAWSANALDIRQFFRGLGIPEGGVHIVGGEQGDAFIAFSTDEDARQAMMHDGGKIKEMKIKLLLSSRTEMQKVIETARQQTLSLQSFMQTSAVQSTSSIGLQSSTGGIGGVAAAASSPPITSNQMHQKLSTTPEKRDNDSETSSSKDRRDRRDRSRSRSRDRGRDRGRDSRRRRDRSRSRERDRRDRGNNRRRRERSRSRDRTRSHERDNNNRRSNDRRKNSQDIQDDNSDVVCVGQFPKDKLMNLQLTNKLLDNGIWEVPPKNQMQTMMIAPGILGAGVAAITNDNDRNNINFNGISGTPSLLVPNQFSLNGINSNNSILQPPGIANINLSTLPPNLTLPNIGNNNNSRNSWPNDPPPRLTDLRFPRGHNFNNSEFGFSNSSNNNSNSNNTTNSNYRSSTSNINSNSKNTRNNNSSSNSGQNNLSKTIQELEGRRNPNAFQSNNANPFDNNTFLSSIGTNDRLKNNRNSGNGNSTRFSNDNNNSNSNNNIGYCIEIRNMPLNATYSDVRHAFQGIYIRKDGIKLINDTHGNRVGIGYVKFNKIEGREQALSTTRYVRGSEIEMCTLEETIFDKAIDSFNPERDVSTNNIDQEQDTIDNLNSSCIMIIDLPSFAKEVDIIKTFNEWKINDLFISTKKDITNGTTQYTAYIQFLRSEDANTALKQTLKIGPKNITTISITDDKYKQAKRVHENGSDNIIIDGNSSDCIIMRGLPFQINERDIIDYFSDIGIVPRRIHMMVNKIGTPFGGCFCEFESIEEAIRATNKNGTPLGKSIPIIDLISRNKMMDALEQGDSGIIDTIPPFPPMGINDRPRFPPLGAGGVPRFGNGGFCPRGPPPGMMGMPPRPPMIMNRPPMDCVEGFGKPGCVLSLENVPFKADIDEIIEFFRDFDVKRENVIRRYNEKGMPTGDARVAFSSPSEAQRALRELRHCKVRERTIYLKMT
ncbi:hypothetical protein HCN44_000961 [Aphidius gifuensis]|uniref:RRM domain-containing protein n=1 Tax=Aphidius gifuensis TaxID=684658 RepID=A0A834XLC3_APHGI|nr:putative uncharacterized protein DDB_G0282133 [Aphidius gifuensis]KAF7988388.1 hypothetical protein HCN44_000961 [Aphidius gifuensis]